MRAILPGTDSNLGGGSKVPQIWIPIIVVEVVPDGPIGTLVIIKSGIVRIAIEFPPTTRIPALLEFSVSIGLARVVKEDESICERVAVRIRHDVGEFPTPGELLVSLDRLVNCVRGRSDLDCLLTHRVCDADRAGFDPLLIARAVSELPNLVRAVVGNFVGVRTRGRALLNDLKAPVGAGALRIADAPSCEG